MVSCHALTSETLPRPEPAVVMTSTGQRIRGSSGRTSTVGTIRRNASIVSAEVRDISSTHHSTAAGESELPSRPVVVSRHPGLNALFADSFAPGWCSLGERSERGRCAHRGDGRDTVRKSRGKVHGQGAADLCADEAGALDLERIYYLKHISAEFGEAILVVRPHRRGSAIAAQIRPNDPVSRGERGHPSTGTPRHSPRGHGASRQVVLRPRAV